MTDMKRLVKETLETFGGRVAASVRTDRPTPLQPFWMTPEGWLDEEAWDKACEGLPCWTGAAYLLHANGNGMTTDVIADLIAHDGEHGPMDTLVTLFDHDMCDRAYYVEDGWTRMPAPGGMPTPGDLMADLLPEDAVDAVVMRDEIEDGQRRLAVRYLDACGCVGMVGVEFDIIRTGAAS